MTDLIFRLGRGRQSVNRVVRAAAAAILGGAGLLCSGDGVLSSENKLLFGHAQEGVYTSFIRDMLGEDETTAPVGSIMVAETGTQPIKDVWIYRIYSPRQCDNGSCSTIVFFRGSPKFAVKSSGPINLVFGTQYGMGEPAHWLELTSSCDVHRIIVNEADLELKTERKLGLAPGTCK